MTNPDNSSVFETMMHDVPILEELGFDKSALKKRESAYEIAPDDLTRGWLAREISVESDLQGEHVQAGEWALTAYRIHNGIVEAANKPTSEELEERAASATRVGVNGLRRIIRAKQGGSQSEATPQPAPLPYLRGALVDQKAIKKAESQTLADSRRVRRDEVDARRRVSIGESIVGERWRAFVIGVMVTSEALRSDSKKLRTFAGGVAALGVAVLITSEEGRRRSAALWLADRGLFE